MAVALIVAAGSGERLGAGVPKALIELAGRPLVQWSVEVLRGVGAIEGIVIALPPQVSSLQLFLGSGPGACRVMAVEGGAVRSESVRLALAASEEWFGLGAGAESTVDKPENAKDLVLVHDAARPLLTAELVEAVLCAAGREGVDGAIAAAPVTDTIKRADGEGVVGETLDRSSLWAVQTPQVFRLAALGRALDVPAEVLARATDDAWLVERAGGRVVVVPAPRENLKVTTPLDLVLAETLLASRDR